MMDGEFLFFVALFLKSEQKAFSGWIIGFDLQPYDGADPGKSIGEDPKQSAIAEIDVREDIDRV